MAFFARTTVQVGFVHIRRRLLLVVSALLVSACFDLGDNADGRRVDGSTTGGSTGLGGTGGVAGGSGGIVATGGTGGAATFCSSALTTLCADFEIEGYSKLLENGVVTSFAPPFLQGGSTIEVVQGLNSANAALLVSPALDPGTAQAHVELRALAPVAGTTLTYAVSIRVDSADVQGPNHNGIAIGGIELGAGANPYKAHLYLDPADPEGKMPVYFAEVGEKVLTGNPGYEFRPVHGNPDVLINETQWVRLFLTLELPQNAFEEGKATVEFQIAGQAKSPVLTTSIHPSSLGAPTMNVAIIAVASAVTQSGWPIAFDNATLQVD